MASNESRVTVDCPDRYNEVFVLVADPQQP